MPSPATTRRRERGNVVLLAALAIVLFAAVCYALVIPAAEVTLDQEKDLTSAAQVTQYPATLRTTVRRMMAQGVSVHDLDFAGSEGARAAVFGSLGGQAQRRFADASMGPGSRWRFKTAPRGAEGGTTGWFIAGMGSDGRDGKDVFAFLDGLNLQVCTQILRALGLPEEPLVEKEPVDFEGLNEGSPRQLGGAAAGDDLRAAVPFAISAWAEAGKPQPYACVRNGAEGGYFYYHILVDR